MIRCVAAVVCAAATASLGLGLTTINAAAAPAARHHNDWTARSAAHFARRRDDSHRHFVRRRGVVYAVVPPATYFWRGYRGYLVPRRGEVDDACNLPSSGCTNDRRDTQ
jgi:hypothetical protein